MKCRIDKSIELYALKGNIKNNLFDLNILKMVNTSSSSCSCNCDFGAEQMRNRSFNLWIWKTVDQIKAETRPELSKDLRDREENMETLKKVYNMDNNKSKS